MGAMNWRDMQFQDVHNKLRSAEQALVELQKIPSPTPGLKVAIGKYKQQIVKMKTEIARLEKIYVKRRDNAVRPSLLVLKESIADPSFVGSGRSNEAHRTAHRWLNSHKASSTDSFYQQVQAAVVEYAKLGKPAD
jgi:hypothetical protein